ncbi:diguanylate cyclase [Streptomyces griseorubiginosus]|uniref:diguanylate cyclase n=1 Tax=Streptomyces griseorubiginosus TaxID=67304 RepID=UPI001AD68915|nr:diguanylate cyclase [Streptomyces griseorubiginosus]MBO4255524.1 diguanylate cyclase [Streptomyces griseorubiginosus]
MTRGRAADITAGTSTVDVADVTTRYLLYGLLPGWFVPGLADWAMHRRTRIEDTAGTKESLILPHCQKRGGTPTLMMAEIGVPIALTLRYEVNPLLLSVQLGGAAVHEATALWDVRTAVDSDREVKPVEQHIHSFLKSLPFGALAALMCLHADQVTSLLRGGGGDADAWRLVPRRRPLSRGYLAGIAAAIGTCVVLPYGEELLRCVRTGRRNRKRASDRATWRTRKGR